MKKLGFIIMTLRFWLAFSNTYAQSFSFQEQFCMIDSVRFPRSINDTKDTNYLLSKFTDILGHDYKKTKISQNPIKANGNCLAINYHKKGITLYTNAYQRKYFPDPHVLQIEFCFWNETESVPRVIKILDHQLSDEISFDEVYNDPFWQQFIFRTTLEDKYNPGKWAIWFEGAKSYGGMIKFREVAGQNVITSVIISL